MDQTKLQDLRIAGFNRLSLGAQSFSDSKLDRLGRIHQALDIKIAFGAARKAGFTNINLDLIFGVDNETLASWQQDITQACTMQPEHLSIYNLTIEPKTEFGRRQHRGEVITSNEEASALMFESAQSILLEHDYRQYEVSNYARQSYECIHNLNYWNFTPYLGLGAGAHSFLPLEYNNECKHYGMRWSNLASPTLYANQVMKRGEAVHEYEMLTSNERYSEYLMLRLRTSRGIDRQEYYKMFGHNFLDKFEPIIASLDKQNKIHQSDHYIALTPQGMLLADEIILQLLSHIDPLNHTMALPK
jgi:oxygen-independent coproporphyrinogen-3 oxidase